MVTYYEYFKNILTKILLSYDTLLKLDDKPGDLDIIKKEILKINSFFHVLVNKIDAENYQSNDLLDLKSKFQYYLTNYSFEKEINTLALLYSDDPNRLKNLRLKILESLTDKKIINNIKYITEKL